MSKLDKLFFVTDHGIQVEGRGVLPGSTLRLKSEPPAHWSRFGTLDQAEAEAWAEKKMQVATPKAGNDGKTKKRIGLEKQASDLEVAFSDETTDDDLVAAIKAKKAAAK
ncbi:hypothetical protein GCM10007928_02280 [Sulfitobacter porphyrae]|nr:hypothetical protein GCM10007928_02280 [Sulfitobacter porphyrae]